jgi:pantothenate kinase
MVLVPVPARGSLRKLATVDRLTARAESLLEHGRRAIIGIVGAPGSGKTTLAAMLESRLNAGCEPSAPRCRMVPMDGFHLSDAVLRRLGRLDRKGAIDTFDGWGYRSLLERVRSEVDHPVFAPSFERDLEQPIAAGIMVEPSVRIVITEGNYLLMGSDPWPRVRAALDEVWFCELPAALRFERLVARHIEFGKAPEQARRWVEEVDEPNARAVEATAGGADLVVEMPT